MKQPSPHPRSRNTCLIVCLVGLAGFSLLAGLALVAFGSIGGRSLWTGEAVAVVRVEGPITASGGSSLLGAPLGASAERLTRAIRRAVEDETIRAIVVRVDSPGGAAAGSQEIYAALRQARAKKPTVASLGDVAASGGYYVASGCDWIVANPATLTGSIGVLMGSYSLEELFEKIGVEPQTLKSGKYKDIGSFDRRMTPAERQLMQAMIDDVHELFIHDVHVGRQGRIKEKSLRAIADGRLLTGRQAQEVGLVDQLGGFREAVQYAAQAAGIQGEPYLVEYGRSSPLERFLGAQPSPMATPWLRLHQLLQVPEQGLRSLVSWW